jgi:methylated-DNA-[protein]-cysteine S-methyltransferase
MMIQHQPPKHFHVLAMPSPRIFQSHTTSPLGDVLLAATEQGLTGVWFVQGQLHKPDSRQWVTDDAHPTLLAAAQQLHEYFSGQRQSFDLPLAAHPLRTHQYLWRHCARHRQP